MKECILIPTKQRPLLGKALFLQECELVSSVEPRNTKGQDHLADQDTRVALPRTTTKQPSEIKDTTMKNCSARSLTLEYTDKWYGNICELTSFANHLEPAFRPSHGKTRCTFPKVSDRASSAISIFDTFPWVPLQRFKLMTTTQQVC